MTTQTHTSNSRDSTKWLIRFFLFSMVFFFIVQNAFFKSLLTQYYTPILIYISSKVMNIMGVGHDIVQNTFFAGSEQFTISESCTGIFVFLLLCGAILSFPVTWKARLQGLLMGFGVLFLLNIARIILIIMAGKQFSGSFWTLHIIVGQIIIIAGTVTFFIFWLNHMTTGHFLSDILTRKKIIKPVFMFAVGYGLGLVFYDFFLKSSFGINISMHVQEHSLKIIDLLHILFKGLLQTDQLPVIGFNIGCLSSPMIVVLIAIVSCMPWPIKHKIFVLVIGFIPVFYVYHLIRAVLTAMSFVLGESKNTSVIYNCFGQFFLALLGILFFWYEEYADRQNNVFPVIGRIAKGIIIGSIAAAAGGFLYGKMLIPAIVSVFRSSENTYNFQLTISTMAYFQFFILFVLIWSNRAIALEKIKFSIYGSAGLLICMTVLTGLIEVFALTPDIGILKTMIILIPFAGYYFLKQQLLRT